MSDKFFKALDKVVTSFYGVAATYVPKTGSNIAFKTVLERLPIEGESVSTFGLTATLGMSYSIVPKKGDKITVSSKTYLIENYQIEEQYYLLILKED